jgi:hypothetical protein
MARHGLAHFRARVSVVFASVPDEHAAHAREFLNEFDALHDT